ncbi:FlgD immunoglobulin-like domain containing protein [Candidatus Eisenbacteria bacterium]|uniref:FlgD immunoglobulin-like domain containing protein n=1 Tax=Eiseniibacteriota bacterium TaxID=2212470 RepID=A0ABV6YJ05_UNCEI
MRIPAAHRRWFVPMMMVLCLSGVAHADFKLVEDFQTLDLGPIDGQNDWRAPSDSSMVVLDPSGGDNQYLSVITESTYLHRQMSLPNETIRMVFFRFRFESQLSCSFGMSDLEHPTRFDHFESELSLTNSTAELRINDGGTYDVLTTLAPGRWYNCWLQIDNVNDQTQVWLHARPGDGAGAADQLDVEGQTIFDFRNRNAGDLASFYIKTGGGSGVAGPLLIDDIHIEGTDTLNFSNPVATTAATADLQIPVGIRLLPGTPNPFSPQTGIRFVLSEPTRIDLAVFDLSGRRVANLAGGVETPGQHEIVWHGRNSQGEQVDSGVYLVRMRANQFVQTDQLLRLK